MIDYFISTITLHQKQYVQTSKQDNGALFDIDIHGYMYVDIFLPKWVFLSSFNVA